MSNKNDRGMPLRVALRELCEDPRSQALFDKVQRESYLVGVWWRDADKDVSAEGELNVTGSELVQHHKISLIRVYQMLWHELRRKLSQGQYVAGGLCLETKQYELLDRDIFNSAIVRSLKEGSISWESHNWRDVKIAAAQPPLKIEPRILIVNTTASNVPYLRLVSPAEKTGDDTVEQAAASSAPGDANQQPKAAADVSTLHAEAVRKSKSETEKRENIAIGCLDYQIQITKKLKSKGEKKYLLSKLDHFHYSNDHLGSDIKWNPFERTVLPRIKELAEKKKSQHKAETGKDTDEFEVFGPGKQHKTIPRPRLG